MPDKLPGCERAEGCPIEELAKDPVVEEFCQDFIAAKMLYKRTEDPRTQEFIFNKWGLYESPRTLLNLETIWAEWIQSKKA